MDLRDPKRMTEAVRLLWAINTGHRKIGELLDCGAPNEACREARELRYRNAVDALEGALIKLAELQEEITAHASDAMVENAIANLLAPRTQRFPTSDEHN